MIILCQIFGDKSHQLCLEMTKGFSVIGHERQKIERRRKGMERCPYRCILCGEIAQTGMMFSYARPGELKGERDVRFGVRGWLSLVHL